ncbi:MAG: hypothetical protein HY075_02725 [Deltaproteobacteria bacterium]|nr:hypothetical protein [Deltaproteobacteria bacterium]
MDISKTEANREVESLKRQLKDREIDHSRETDNLRQAQREQIDALSDAQKSSLDRVRQNSEEAFQTTREKFDEEINKNTDYYQKALKDERAEGYDRYGRLSNEASRDRAQTADRSMKALNEMREGDESRLAAERENSSRTVKKMQGSFQEERAKLEQATNDKLARKDKALQDSADAQKRNASTRVDDGLRRAAEESQRDRMSADHRYHKLAEDSKNEHEHTLNAFATREAQLVNDKTFAERDTTRRAQAAFDEYRERTSRAMKQSISDGNTQAGEQRRQTDAKIAKLSADGESDRQRLRNEFRSAEADLTARNQMDRDRAELQAELSSKRHRQEVAAVQTASTDNSSLTNDLMKDHYNETLHDLNDTSKRNFEKFQATAQRHIAEADMRSSSDLGEIERLKAKELNQQSVAHSRDRHQLIRAYESRQSASDDLHERQTAALKEKVGEDIIAVNDKAAKELRQNNLEATTQIYGAKRQLGDLATEMDYQRRSELSAADDKYRERVKRVTETYNRHIMTTQDAFDEANNEFKAESHMQMAKARGDAEHEKRIALMEMISKNRAIMAGYESKMSSMKDDHDAELAKMKSDNDKAMRETMKRAREQIETDRSLHQRELAAKEVQTKEKLKLQEEAFRDTVEKLKRSQEAQIRKA